MERLWSRFSAATYQTPIGTVFPSFVGSTTKRCPRVYGTNLTSLICGYVGNIFLLLNFTNRVPYIFALPVTVFLWYISFAIVS